MSALEGEDKEVNAPGDAEEVPKASEVPEAPLSGEATEKPPEVNEEEKLAQEPDAETPESQPVTSGGGDEEKPADADPPPVSEPSPKAAEEEQKKEAVEPVTSTVPNGATSPQAVAPANALATLAAEAVKAGPQPTDEDNQNLIQAPTEAPKLSGGQWHSVGIFSGNTCKVTGYTTQDLAEELRSAHFDISKLPAGAIDETAVQKLEAGEFYRFRVRAFNSCGFGPWSDVTTFRTTVPGFPSPPSGVKITSTKEGVHLSWHPPQDQPDEIIEYSVYLAVKGSAGIDATSPAPVANQQMAFKRVYIGPASSCLVPTAVLTDAHVTTTTGSAVAQTKPAILFRIAARNKKGYGPSIQVRWIQGENQGATPTQGTRRPAEDSEPASSKKKRKE